MPQLSTIFMQLVKQSLFKDTNTTILLCIFIIIIMLIFQQFSLCCYNKRQETGKANLNFDIGKLDERLDTMLPKIQRISWFLLLYLPIQSGFIG